MSKPEPRSATTLREIEYQLRPFLASEAVEIIARVMARTVARDPRQFIELTELFKHAFAAEHGYLSSRQTPTGPDAYNRRTRSGVA
jgi:hypothetical protein